MRSVKLNCSHTDGYLELSSDSRGAGEPYQEFTASLYRDGFQSEARIFDMPWSWLAHYFIEIAGEWRGWSGVKTWAGDGMQIEASHDGSGHALFTITIEDCSWRCVGLLRVELGALSKLSRDVARFFGVPLDA